MLDNNTVEEPWTWAGWELQDYWPPYTARLDYIEMTLPSILEYLGTESGM